MATSPSACSRRAVGEERRRVRLAVRGRVAGERHAGGEQDEPRREHAVDEAVRPAARGVQREQDPDQRDGVEEVALLDAVAAEPVGGRLDEERDDERGRERAEGQLLSRSRPPQREPETEHGPGREHDAGGVGEEHRVGAEPLRHLRRGDVEVEDALVEAESSARPDRHERQHRDQDEPQDERLLAKRAAHAPLPEADDEHGRRGSRRGARRTGRGRRSPARRGRGRRAGGAGSAGRARASRRRPRRARAGRRRARRPPSRRRRGRGRRGRGQRGRARSRRRARAAARAGRRAPPPGTWRGRRAPGRGGTTSPRPRPARRARSGAAAGAPGSSPRPRG